MATVRLHHVGKTYPNGQVALKDIDLSIKDGELMVVVGPSGCGKSTLLRVLAGLETITQGELLIDDCKANDLSPQRRNIAMVFQDYALYPTMSVRENLSFPLKMRKLSSGEIRKKVAWAADLLDLGEVLERLPKQLSGGQRQRVAMGRALVREPSVFLLDEPLSNLDTKLRAQVRTEIGDLQKRTGTTMIYVTHDQVEAMTLGHRITILDQGVIQQIATPEALYDDPASSWVAGFIGTPPMNLGEALITMSPLHYEVTLGQETMATLSKENPPVSIMPALDNGHSILMGVRPEALLMASDHEPGFMATVTSLEYLGHETLVHLRPLGAPASLNWIMRAHGQSAFAAGSLIRLARLQAANLHFFRF
ncbi:MAG: ATP-binding cassette domain-containing protein [Methylococcus sp.]|nr:MAG: ATP-binding cassette domain-containing protein [Methylococcus sp.]